MLSQENIARVCYMVQYEIQLVLEDPIPHWDCTPPWMRSIWTDGVRMAQLGHSPEQLHEHWRARMAEEGWSYGPQRDPEQKLHPMLLPRHQLDELSLAKERLVQATIVMLTLNLPQEVMGMANLP